MTALPLTTTQNGTWVIDPSHSDVTFSVRHLMISKVRGSFGKLSGEIKTDGELETVEITATLDAASITTNDEGRDGHLRSADFFDVETFPEITFKSTGLVATKKSDKFLVNGELTIKGVTKPVTLDLELGGVAVDGYGQTKAAASADTVISRGDFGLTWNSTLETGGVLVGDEITIQLDIQAVLQK